MNVGGQSSSSLSREAHLDLSQDSGSVFQEHSQVVLKPLLHYFSCMLGIMILLKGEPSVHSEVVNTL